MSQLLDSSYVSLRVAIVGGGIAGLAAASVLRKTHNVTIYERTKLSQMQEQGAAVGIAPNGSKMLKRLELSKEDLHAVVNSGLAIYDTKGSVLNQMKHDYTNVFGSEYWLVHRQDLWNALFKAATDGNTISADGRVKFIQGAMVSDVDVISGELTFEDGSKAEFDIVIAADGIRSNLRSIVVQDDAIVPVSSGLSLYCFAFTLDEIKQILDVLPEQLRQDGEASLAVIVPKDYSHRSIVMYPCRDKEIINFGAIVPNALLKETPTDSWTAEGKIEDMLEIFHDYPDWVKQLMGQISNPKLFGCYDIDPLPNYAQGRVLLIGDAAHPMRPFQGQGANMALEDADALRLLQAPDIKRDRIPHILVTIEKARLPRASKVQLHSRVSAGAVLDEEGRKRMIFNWTYDGIESVMCV